MEPGSASFWYISEVPQVPQNVRVTPGEEWNDLGLPLTNENPSSGKVSQATDCAPKARWQETQWQISEDWGSPVAAKRTLPQKHPPS